MQYLKVDLLRIASTSTPTTSVVLVNIRDTYDAAYFIVQVSDFTNNIHQLSEVALSQ